MKKSHENQPSMKLEREGRSDGVLPLKLAGNWKLDQDLPPLDAFKKLLAAGPKPRQLDFETSHLTGWDSGLLTFINNISGFCRENNIAMDLEGLPEGVRRLLKLAAAVPPKTDTGRDATSKVPLFSNIGDRTLEFVRASREVLDFVGDATLVFVKLLGGKARFRGSDLIMILQETGAQALPIVSLISLLVGLILAFVGAVQLAMFGAQIYIANLVGIAMTREMGAMMAAIIMAGRTGAAFAAQLGTMQVNEEIDALKTLGVSPMEFLVLPRMLALVLMMPLLCIYADLLGMLGGALVSIGAFDVTLIQYATQTQASITLTHIAIGVVKSVIFGIIIALSGCLRGMQCGRSATQVGYAATSAVVTAIVWIIAVDGLFAVMTNVLGI